jgi:hypothetical protein
MPSMTKPPERSILRRLRWSGSFGSKHWKPLLIGIAVCIAVFYLVRWML